jgi:hypothetical protein
MRGILDWSSFEANGTLVTLTTVCHSLRLTYYILVYLLVLRILVFSPYINYPININSALGQRIILDKFSDSLLLWRSRIRCLYLSLPQQPLPSNNTR